MIIFFKCKWNEVYDFIEFIANEYPDNGQREPFINWCNGVLQEEVSAYRFVGGKITQLTSETEILEIEAALQLPLAPVNEHLNRALELFADRKAPDYRNSIKESISAVESLCRVIAKNEKATLGDALQEIEKLKTINLHSALKAAFEKLYGYTSDEGGIRHALIDQPNSDAEEAKFMLVSCSAFINYLRTKAKL